MASTKDFFEQKLAQKIKENPACLIIAQVTNQIVATDIDGAGQWSFIFNESGHLSMESGIHAESHCTIMTSDKTFQGMLDWSVNIPMAFVMRKIKIKG